MKSILKAIVIDAQALGYIRWRVVGSPPRLPCVSVTALEGESHLEVILGLIDPTDMRVVLYLLEWLMVW